MFSDLGYFHQFPPREAVVGCFRQSPSGVRAPNHQSSDVQDRRQGAPRRRAGGGRAPRSRQGAPSSPPRTSATRHSSVRGCLVLTARTAALLSSGASPGRCSAWGHLGARAHVLLRIEPGGHHCGSDGAEEKMGAKVRER